MKLKAFVLEDNTREYAFTGEDGKPVKGTSRTLVCVDLDEGDRIESTFKVRIPLDTTETALRDKMVDLSITRIAQNADSKQLAFAGRVLKVHGGKVAA